MKELDAYQYMRAHDLPLPEDKPEVDYEALCEGDAEAAAENLKKLADNRPLKPPVKCQVEE